MRIALLGYGSFGRTLGSLMADAGIDYRALDPMADIPAPHRASALPELLAGAGLVVLAVPGPRAVLEELRPLLEPSQLVVDVGSVKVKPVRTLEEVLGARVPWVGTHPLFGPRSLARGERPLRVVICPNALHPEAAPRARRFYEQLGCEIIEQTPEAHDRVMAYTHALTYFVARGLMDAGTGQATPFAPASFQALARTIDTVRAGEHLFNLLQNENPFASQARRHLLRTYTEIHDELESLLAEARAPESAPEAFPDIEAGSPELRAVREQIDQADRELVELLGRRAELARRAADIKARAGQPVPDPHREEELLASRRAWATALGLDGEGVETIFRAILRFSRRSQHTTGS